MPNKELRLTFTARVIQHLGIDMYQKPSAVLAEFVANSFDADANIVDIKISEDEIIIHDDGNGMSFDECQDKFLTVGVDKREGGQKKKTSIQHRPMMGRKGIGKFAGFGIAKTIRVETVSRTQRDKTIFTLDYEKISEQSSSKQPHIEVEMYEENSSDANGTLIRLKNLDRNVSRDEVRKELARRFCLVHHNYNFQIKVDGEELTVPSVEELTEFSFPRQTPDLFADTVVLENGWGKTTLRDGKTFLWQINLFKDTVKEAELRGISVFVHAKLAQAPWTFEIGAVEGQHGLSYMTGKVIADFIDDEDVDLIATERQRINWNHEKTACLYSTMQEFIKKILKQWAELRAAGKIAKINEKTNQLKNDIESLKTSDDRKIVHKAILNLAKIPTITQKQLEEMGHSIVAARRKGRVTDLICRISTMENPSEQMLLEALKDTNFINALNYTEIISLKLNIIQQLKKLINEKALENTIRDFLSQNPWLIAEELETFKVETSLNHIFEESSTQAFSNFDGKRVDLILSSSCNLILFEFMRPDKPLDEDHLARVQQYVNNIVARLRANTAIGMSLQKTYVVADELAKTPALTVHIESLEKLNIYAMDWNTLLANAEKQYKEFIDNFRTRQPEKDILNQQENELSSDKSE